MFLPRIDDLEQEDSNASMGKLLLVPEISLAIFGTFAAATNIGFLQALLEPHIRFMNLTPNVVGLVLMASGLVYALIAPLWGKLCDRGINSLALSICGALFIIDGFQLLGPAPYLNSPTTLRIVLVALVLNGIGCGGELIPSFTGAQEYAILAGFGMNMATYGAVSGLWTSAFALGAFCGPVIGGLLKMNYGFKVSTYYITSLHSLLIISHVTYFLLKASKIRVPFGVRDVSSQSFLEADIVNYEGEPHESVGSAKPKDCLNPFQSSAESVKSPEPKNPFDDSVISGDARIEVE